MELPEGQMMELLVRRLALAQLAVHRAHLVIYTLESKAMLSPNYLVSLVTVLKILAENRNYCSWY